MFPYLADPVTARDVAAMAMQERHAEARRASMAADPHHPSPDAGRVPRGSTRRTWSWPSVRWARPRTLASIPGSPDVGTALPSRPGLLAWRLR